MLLFGLFSSPTIVFKFKWKHKNWINSGVCHSFRTYIWHLVKSEFFKVNFLFVIFRHFFIIYFRIFSSYSFLLSSFVSSVQVKKMIFDLILDWILWKCFQFTVNFAVSASLGLIVASRSALESSSIDSDTRLLTDSKTCFFLISFEQVSIFVVDLIVDNTSSNLVSCVWILCQSDFITRLKLRSCFVNPRSNNRSACGDIHLTQVSTSSLENPVHRSILSADEKW